MPNESRGFGIVDDRVDGSLREEELDFGAPRSLTVEVEAEALWPPNFLEMDPKWRLNREDRLSAEASSALCLLKSGSPGNSP